ncbi:MAG: membrane protein insertase YidC [Desulfobacterales bacterium]|nr:membrane protein insertase YidC [Desulfobacterales bacterium]
MEQTRLLLAILLTFLVFVAWEFFFSPRPEMPITPDQAPPTAPEEVAEKPAPPVAAAPAEAPRAPAIPTPPTAARKGRLVTVETPLYKVVLSENGGVIKSLTLKQFSETVGRGAALKTLVDSDAVNNNLKFGLEGGSVPGLDAAVYGFQGGTETLTVKDTPGQVDLVWASPGGVEIGKTLTFYPDTYLIDVAVRVTNRGAGPITDKASLAVSRVMDESPSRVVFEGLSGFIDGNLKEIAVGDIEDDEGTAGQIDWVGIVDRYFMSALIPADTPSARMQVAKGAFNTITNALVSDAVNIAPGQTQSFTYKAFYGPKHTNLLRAYGHNLAKAINFGWFDFLAKPALWFMNLIYSVIPNYGIAIILLTVMTKIILWPLGNKSYKSMNEMKRMQPLMAEIREKYKDDKKKMNEEMMGLYRTYKINPMGGCLPMLVQLPVFLALYNMLYGSIELRHAPFVGWITDLSSPDRLFSFGFSIPFMEPPYGIPVLTVIMGATMFLQQKMSPPPGDPAQAKIMLFLPIIFTFIFINFPAGLVLYWLINNILSIAQQYYIQKKYA